MSSHPPTQIIVGPPSNGAVEYARDLAEAVSALSPSVETVHVSDAADALDAVRSHGQVHLHVTDSVFGQTLEAASAVVAALTLASCVSITLHDVPQSSDGDENLMRRATAYRRMVERAVGVAVSSRHEADLVAEHVGDGIVSAVVPLGTRVPRSPSAVPEFTPPDSRAADRATAVEILLAGYVYPGKGHDDVIAAAGVVAARSGLSIAVTALGGVSPGHSDLADSLVRLASEHGVDFTATGRLDEADYRRRVRTGGIPVVAHRHYSASRSLLDWAEQGRRALVVENRYASEMARLRPGTLDVVGPETGALADAIERRISHPELTRLPPNSSLGPTLGDAARDYLAWWASLPW